MRIAHLVILAACALSPCTAALAESPKSAAPAEEVLKALAQHNLTYLAAKDPNEAGRFVAAMRLGDDQLFVISAQYEQPALIKERLLSRDYQWVYQELNSASKRDGRLFVQDLGVPGLRASRQKQQAFDVVYESAVHRTAFDGDWKAQQLSRDAYEATFDRVDTGYAHALDALVATLSADKGM
jgi:hypothetical protein